MHSRTLTSRVSLVVVAAAAVAVMGAGCGAQAGPGMAAPSAGRSMAAPSAGPIALAIPINAVRLAGNDRRSLSIEYAVGVGDCAQTLDRADVAETAATVTVSLVPDPPATPTPAYCLDQVRLLRTTVRLDAPLGERKLIDGTTGTVVPVQGR